MHDPLLVKTCLKTIMTDQILVVKDRLQMTGKIMPIVHSVSFPYKGKNPSMSHDNKYTIK